MKARMVITSIRERIARWFYPEVFEQFMEQATLCSTYKSQCEWLQKRQQLQAEDMAMLREDMAEREAVIQEQRKSIKSYKTALAVERAMWRNSKRGKSKAIKA